MAVNEVELLCIGNAVVDIFVRSDEQEAIRLGITRHVQHIEIEKLREILRTLKIPETLNGPMTSSGCTIVSGGGAANVAKIAGLLGAKAGFIGAYGKETNEWAGAFQPDQFGRIFEKSLGAAGVKTWLTLKSSPTGLCLFLKVRDDTRIVASPSAALELSESNIRDEYLEKARVVVIDGFILDRPGLVRHILRRVNQYGAVAALDLSSPAIAKERSTEISGIARQYPLILFMNEDEAEAFYEGLGSPNQGEDGVMGLLPFMTERRSGGSRFRYICSFFCSLTRGELFPIIVVKLGKRGALTFTGGSIHRAETQAVTPLDTTGAGDAFAAAFLTAWVRKKSLPECTSLGNKAARIVLDVAGTQVEKKQFRNIARQLK